MKLRTKLMLLVGLVTTVAIALSIWIIMFFLRQNIMESVVDSGISDYQKFLVEYVSISREAEDMSSLARNKYLAYQLRNFSGSEEFLLQIDDTVLFNNTGVDAKKALSHGEATEYYINENGSYAQYEVVEVNGEVFFITGGSTIISSETYFIALVRNISNTIVSMKTLGLKCAGTGLIIAIIAALAMLFLIYQSLKPIQKLQLGASELAQGNYKRRIKLIGGDELSELANSFNQMADAIERHIREIEATSEERKMLLSALSHEMKTPVTAITGYSYALMRVKMTEEQKQEAVFFIDSECKRLERLSGKLMQLISMEGQNLILAEVPIDTLFDELRAILMPIADKEDIALEIKSDNEIYHMEKDLILCLIINLVDNAKKAGADRIRVFAKNHTLSVIDNGKGISTEHIGKITQPFYTVDSARHIGNCGLGLALCGRIAEIHKTELKITSKIGRGTVVQVRL